MRFPLVSYIFIRLLLIFITSTFFVEAIASLSNIQMSHAANKNIEMPEDFSKAISGREFLTGEKKNISFDQQKNGTVLLFLSARCPCSDGHIPAVRELAHTFGKKGFAFIGINSNANESFDEAKDYFNKKELPFPVIKDELSRIANHFEAFKTPHVYVVNSSGKIVFQGGVDDSRVYEKAKKHYLKEALTAIQLGEEPPEKSVRVMGCEIQRPE